MSFFLWKNDFKCHSWRAATDKQTTREQKLKVAILELVDRIRCCIVSSLQHHKHVQLRFLLFGETKNKVGELWCLMFSVYLSRRLYISSWTVVTESYNFFNSSSIICHNIYEAIFFPYLNFISWCFSSHLFI